mgnify:FL=1
MKKKNFDFIVANDVTEKGAGFKGDTNIVTIIDKSGESNKYPMMSKESVAKIIMDSISDIIKNKS